jgi:hypothetical protein
MLDLSRFKFKNHVTHYIIDTGDTWNRSKTCNFGFKRAKTPLVSSWDADFIFPRTFSTTMNKVIERHRPDLNFLRVWCTETGSCIRRGTKFKRNDLYGGMYVYDTKKLARLGGYDETFINYGWEEKDFNDRYALSFALREKWIKKKGVVYHKSHDEAISGDKSNYDINKDKRNSNIINRNFIVNKDIGWENSKLIATVDYSIDGHVKQIKEQYFG